MSGVVPMDLSGVLVAPSSPSSVEQAIERVTSAAIPGLSQIDAVIGLIVGFSPLEEWVFKPFIGDWSAMERAAEAWPRCGDAVRLVNERVQTVSSFVGDGWEGAAADSFAECQSKLSKLLADLPFQCEQAGVMDAELAEFAKGILAFIGEVIQGIIEIGLEILTAVATPPVGWAAAIPIVAVAVSTVLGWISRIMSLFNQFLGFLEAVAAIHSGIAGLYSSVRQAVQGLQLAANLGSQAVDLLGSVAGKVSSVRGGVKSATSSTAAAAG